MVDSNITVKWVTRNVKDLDRIKSQMKGVGGQIKVLDTGVGNLGNRLGFVAFQFTFLAGVAGAALRELTGGLSRAVTESAETVDQVIRAIAQSGLDITRTTEGATESIQFMNNAIRDLGSGRTIFSTRQVAEAAKEIGRAFSFSGTQQQIAAQSAAVLEANLRLMTIEQISAEDSAVALSKIMKQFGKGAGEAANVVNTLVTVNQQSSITLDGLIRSLGFAGGFATEAGISLEKLAVILGVLQDRLGRAGGGPGENFRVLLENLSRISTGTDKRLRSFGIVIRDNTGQMNDIVDILRQFNQAMEQGGEKGSIVRQAILEIGTKSVRARTGLLNLIQGFDDLEKGLKNIEDTTVAERLEAVFTETPLARINRLKNAVNSLRDSFVGGLSPALELIVTEVRKIITDTNIDEFFRDVGRIVGEEVVPVVRFLAGAFKALVTSLKQNEIIMAILTKGFIGLVSVLTLLFIIGSIGALVAVLAAAMQRFAGFIGLTTAATIGFLRVLLPLVAFGLGLFIVLKSLDNIIGLFKDGLQASELPALALNTALIALGITIAALSVGTLALGSLRAAIVGLGSVFSITGFTGAITAMKTAFTGLIAAITSGNVLSSISTAGANLGTKLQGGFITNAARVSPGLANILARLGSGVPIIAAITAAAIIAIAFTQKFLDEAKNSEVFKTGLVELWDIVGFKMKVATTKFLQEIVKFFQKAFIALRKGMEEFVGAFIEIFSARNFEDFLKAVQKFINAHPLNLTKFFSGIGDLDALGKEMIEKILKGAQQKGKSPFSADIQKAVQEVIAETGFEVTPEEVNEIIKKIFGDIKKAKQIIIGTPAFSDVEAERLKAIREEIDAIKAREAILRRSIGAIDPTTQQPISASDVNDELNNLRIRLNTLTLELENFRPGTSFDPEQLLSAFAAWEESLGNITEQTDIIQEEFEKQSETLEKSIEVENKFIEEIKKANQIVKEKTGVDLTHIGEITTNTDELIENSGIMEVDTDTLRDEIIKLSDNQNRLTDFSVVIDKAAIAFTKLAIEGTEAARRLSTLRVSTSGKFSISGRQTSTTFNEIGELANQIKEKEQKLNEELSDLVLIDTKKLEEELKAKQIFDSDLIQKADKGFISSESLISPAGQTSTIAGLSKLIESAIASGLSPAAIKPLINQLNQLLLEQKVPGLQFGGIVKKPLLAAVGEGGPEAVIPLNRLEGIGGGITNNITVNVEGIADGFTADDIAERIVNRINDNIKGRNLVRR